MSGIRSALAFVSLILVAGAVVLEFFVILGGAINGTPVSNVWFLEADTSGITGQNGQISHWTYWNSCPSDGNDANTLCGVSPAYPFDPQNNFGTQNNVAGGFIGTNKFYLETRFMFAFALIALVFSVLALLGGLLALCSRLGSFLSGGTTTTAFIFQALTSALMTAAYVEGRNIFNGNGQYAALGRYAFGFNWGATAALLIATVLFCVGGGVSKDKDSRRNRNAKNRGSFIDGDASSFTRA